MALTNAQKQQRHRAKRKAMLERYEAALKEIAEMHIGQPSLIAYRVLHVEV